MFIDSDEKLNAPNFGVNGMQEDEGEYNSRLLKSKAHRQKIEENVIALQNRISFLENEENKLLGKIEKTKNLALEVIKIKRNTRLHNDMVNNAKFAEKEYIITKKEEVHDMKEELNQNMRGAYQAHQQESMSKADQVKANLNSLKEEYIQHKRWEQRDLIEKCNVQKQFEKNLEAKKEKILV